MTTTNEKSYPLAKDINGDPIDVPPEATAWRVRRRSGKQGRPQSVFDPETGTPLEIELDSEIDELRPSGAGGYRLDAIDGDGKLIPGVTAYVEVPAEESARPKETESPTETAATLRELTQLLRESMQTNCRTLEAMATAFGPVHPAAPPPQPPIYMAPPQSAQGSDEKSADMMTKLMEFIPVFQGFMQMLPSLIQMFKAAGAATSPQAAAATESVPPTGVMS